MSHPVTYLSPAEPVSMGDIYFDMASVKHFWVRRRFEVLRRLLPQFDWPKLKLAEFGSGSGVVQSQFEDAFGMTVDGFDLNETALKNSVSRDSPCFCYNIHARHPELRQAYDAILLFDVIEHIDDDKAFLASALFHLKSGGSLIINVPALPSLFSAYDTVGGHKRRYLAENLLALMKSCDLQTTAWTYWGGPIVPLLRVRKWKVDRISNPDEVLRTGFDPGNPLLNSLLLWLSRCEPIPQHFTGTSVMLAAQLK